MQIISRLTLDHQARVHEFPASARGAQTRRKIATMFLRCRQADETRQKRLNDVRSDLKIVFARN